MTNLTIRNFSDSDELYRYFVKYGRGDNFTRQQMDLIYDIYLDAAPEFEIDVIGICCEFTGYDSIDAAMKDLGFDNLHEMEKHCLVFFAPNGEVVVHH